VLIRLGLAVLVLALVAVGALLLFLPRLAESPAVRQRIEQAAHDATGREFRYEDLSFALLPPRLVIEQPVLSGERPEDPPWVEARGISLRLALAPLLARAVVLESLVIEDATLRLVRDADGLRLPVPPADDTGGEGPTPDQAPPRDAPADGDAGAGVSLAVKKLALRGSRVVLEDRTVSPPAMWDVQDVDLDASIPALDEPLDFRLDARVGGGSVRAKGRADLAAETADVEVTLDGLGMAAAAPYLDGAGQLGGALSGTVSARGSFASPSVKADLRLADGDVRLEDVALRGALDVGADLTLGDALSGTFDIDATDASLDAAEGAFTKPPGRPARVKGRLVPRSDGGLTVDDVVLKIHNVEATGKVETGKRLRAELTADPFSLEGWPEILPALAEYRPRGTLRPGTLRVATEPLEIHGRIGLDALELAVPDAADVGVEGALEGTGDALRLVDVVLSTGGEQVAVGGEISGLAGTPRYRLSLDADGAETNTLLSAFSSVEDRVFGPLFLDTKLSGVAGDEDLSELAGRVSFAIRPGRLKGVSILEETVGRLGTFGEAAMLVAGLQAGDKVKKMERFYGDDFQEAAGIFDVRGGWARTDDLRLIYDNYRVDLTGRMRLADRRLDFRGRLTIDEEVDEALADASDGETPEPRQRVIELAAVKGTLDDPDVELSSQVVRSWVGAYTASKLRRKYQEDLDERLGEDLGGEVGDLVEGLLGGRKKK
jgi:uncharacterized protein involved in outer membrane biogenesis